MLIQKAVREDCKECGHFKREISPEKHGCDKCATPIVPYGNDERLEVSVFHNECAATDHFYFCSWRCVLAFVRTIKTDHFYTLPYVCADNKIVGRRAKDFISALKKGA